MTVHPKNGLDPEKSTWNYFYRKTIVSELDFTDNVALMG